MNSNGARKLADWLRALLGISLLPGLVVFYLASSRAWLTGSIAYIVFAFAGVALLSILLKRANESGGQAEMTSWLAKRAQLRAAEHVK